MKDQIRTATDATHNSAIEALSQRSRQDTSQSQPIDHKAASVTRQEALSFSTETLFDRWWSLTASEDFATLDAEFKTPKDLAGMTRYSESWIRGLCEGGKMPSIKIRGRIRIHVPTLRDAWRKLLQ